MKDDYIDPEEFELYKPRRVTEPKARYLVALLVLILIVIFFSNA
jgi:hypothetical protein